MLSIKMTCTPNPPSVNKSIYTNKREILTYTMHTLVASAAALLANGEQVSTVHQDEYKYADVMAFYTVQEGEHKKKQEVSNRERERAWNEARARFSREVASLEAQYGLIAVDFRKEYRLEERYLDPLTRPRIVGSKEDREEALNSLVAKLDPPPPRPVPAGTPFWHTLELNDPKTAAFLFRHSTLAEAFINGEEGWHTLFLGAEGDLLVKVYLEQVRKSFLLTHKWLTLSRVSLPTRECFLGRYRRMYPDKA